MNGDLLLPRIYACIDECKITRNRYPGDANPDELLLRLYVCNTTGAILENVAAKLLASNVGLCGDSAVQFIAVAEKVYYGRINSSECGSPDPGCKEFIYKTNFGNRSGFYCIHFHGHIHKEVIPPNCNWEKGIPIIEIMPCRRIEIPHQ